MKHADWLVLARDGELLLAAERLPAGDDVNPPAILYNSILGTSSEPKDLQVFFKWGNFEGVDPIPLGEMLGKETKGLTGYGWSLEVQGVPAEARVVPEASKGGPGSGHWAHAGRPGFVGGSAPGGGLRKVCRTPAGDEVALGKKSADAISRAMDGAGLHYGNWRNALGGERGRVKDKLITELAATSGESYDKCNKFVKQWSRSSNNHMMQSLGIQRDAAEEFGVEMSDFTKGRIEWMEDRASKYPMYADDEDYQQLYPSDVQRRILRAQYDNTQKFLREKGIGPDDVVTLYRGAKWDKAITKDWKAGQEVAFHDNALASWSLGEDIARRFWRWDSEKDGVIIKVNVPASMIFSTALTGNGCLTEGELLLIGGRGTAELVDVRRGS